MEEWLKMRKCRMNIREKVCVVMYPVTVFFRQPNLSLSKLRRYSGDFFPSFFTFVLRSSTVVYHSPPFFSGFQVLWNCYTSRDSLSDEVSFIDSNGVSMAVFGFSGFNGGKASGSTGEINGARQIFCTNSLR
jgi:hypothetical protein